MSNTDQHTVFDATPIRTRHITKLCKLAYPWESVSEIQLIEQLDYRYPLSLFLCFEQQLDSCYSKTGCREQSCHLWRVISSWSGFLRIRAARAVNLFVRRPCWPKPAHISFTIGICKLYSSLDSNATSTIALCMSLHWCLLPLQRGTFQSQEIVPGCSVEGVVTSGVITARASCRSRRKRMGIQIWQQYRCTVQLKLLLARKPTPFWQQWASGLDRWQQWKERSPHRRLVLTYEGCQIDHSSILSWGEVCVSGITLFDLQTALAVHRQCTEQNISNIFQPHMHCLDFRWNRVWLFCWCNVLCSYWVSWICSPLHVHQI